MSTLHILRHAKSAWGTGALSDHDRPLNARGELAAVLMGAYMQQQAIRPQLVVCSSAKRTRQTLERVLPFLPSQTEVRFDRRAYLASTMQLVELVKEVGADVESLLLVGHNPGSQYLASHLAASGEAADLIALRDKFPTAALASIALPGGLREVDTAGGALLRFVTPKQLV